MTGITEINASTFAGNRGLIADGINPADMLNPENSFSRIMDMAEKQQQTKAAMPGPVSETTSGIVPRKPHIDKTDKLYEQCLELETFLVKNILNAMRKNVMKSSLIDTGYAGEIYEDMLWDEYAKDYTKNSGFGLADLAYLELTGQRGRMA
jgi:flagellar protein FlgJ